MKKNNLKKITEEQYNAYKKERIKDSIGFFTLSLGSIPLYWFAVPAMFSSLNKLKETTTLLWPLFSTTILTFGLTAMFIITSIVSFMGLFGNFTHIEDFTKQGKRK